MNLLSQARVKSIPDGGQDRPLGKATKLKPEQPWRLQDVRDVRAIGYLLGRAANREQKQPRKKKYGIVKTEWNWKSEESFDIRHGDVEFGSCPAGFGLIFIQYFLTMLAHLPMFLNGNICTVPLFIGIGYLLCGFDFTGDYR